MHYLHFSCWSWSSWWFVLAQFSWRTIIFCYLWLTWLIQTRYFSHFYFLLLKGLANIGFPVEVLSVRKICIFEHFENERNAQRMYVWKAICSRYWCFWLKTQNFETITSDFQWCETSVLWVRKIFTLNMSLFLFSLFYKSTLNCFCWLYATFIKSNRPTKTN